jgi:uncharacterized membrane protein
VVIVAVGAALRLLWLGAAEFWYDEASSVLFARLPFWQMVQVTATDTHPPLFYAVLWAWGRVFGWGEWSMRLPSMLASTAALWVVWQTSGALGLGRGVRLVGLSILAVAQTQLIYAQEARMYGLLELECALVMWGMTTRRWGVVGWSGVALFYTHNYALFYWPIFCLWAVWRLFADIAALLDNEAEDAIPLGRIVLALTLPWLAFVPWALVLAGQMHEVSNGYWLLPVTLPGVFYVLWFLFIMMGQGAVLPLSALTLGGALAWATWRNWRDGLAWQLALLAFGPLALAVGASLAWQPVLLFRGLLGSTPFLVLWLVYAFRDVRGLKAGFAAALVAPVLVAGAVLMYREHNTPREGDVRAHVADLRAQWQPGDAIYHANSGSLVPWLVYAADLQPQFVLPANVCPPGQRTRGALSAATLTALGADQRRIEAVPAGRVWVVWGAGPTVSQCDYDAAQAVAAQGKLFKPIFNNAMVNAGIWVISNGTSEATKRPAP